MTAYKYFCVNEFELKLLCGKRDSPRITDTKTGTVPNYELVCNL
jgi:hypothetical protein